MAFEIKPNNPVTIAVVLVIIIGAILVVESTKSRPFWAGGNASDGNSSAAPVLGASGPQAPELRGLTGYINTSSDISVADLKGKVVMVDFWTYSCINCIRTLPYLAAWDKKYRDKGLVIIGVHTPEFDFEKNIGNVREAVKKFGIEYPVVLDSDYATWNAYQNHWWPHKYLIDKSGVIRFDHIGEGGYDETEQQIVELLSENGPKVEMNPDDAGMPPEQTDFAGIGTPEIYLGYDFARQGLGNEEGFVPEQTVSYSFPDNRDFSANLVFLEGDWKNNSDNVQLESDTGKVALKFKAKNANIVAGSPNGSVLSVSVGGKPVSTENAGDDAVQDENFVVHVNEQRLYNLVSAQDYAEKTLVFDVKGNGFELYTFTFG
ncbi:MAG: thioredoxin family protein [Candidatus Diapherotrites archaeon]|nr:thioredoxin family protein [Candidatus Diapherotrites archaeon]